MDSPSRTNLWSGLVLCALLVGLSDGLIMLASRTPYLFGIIDAFITRFEETLLYLPVIKNFSFSDPLLTDFAGLRMTHSLAPFPYATMALVKILYYLAGGSLNGSIFAIHCLIIAEFAAVYAYSRKYTSNGGAALFASLLVVLGPDFLSLALNFLDTTTSSAMLIAVGVGSIVLFCLGYLIGKHAPRWQIVFLVVAFLTAGVIFEALSQTLLGAHSTGDFIATRYFSPLIPFCFLFTSLYVLMIADERLISGQASRIPLALTIASLVINCYVYFGNWLIFTPIVMLWVWIRRRLLWQDWRFALPCFIIGACFLSPFLWTITASRRIPALSDYLYRAGNFGIVAYHRFNFPALWPLAVNLVLLAIPTCIQLDAHFRRQHRIGMRGWLPLLCYAISVASAYANYLLGEVIPQAQLMLRYWIPFAVLSFLAALPHLSSWRLANRLTSPAVLLAATGCLAAAMGILAIGRWNANNIYSGPAVHLLAQTAGAVADTSRPDDVFVSDWQSLVLLAPIYGLRTLSPNPIMSIATHQELMNTYADLNKLLGRSEDDFINFVGNIDRWGVVHEVNTSAPKSVALLSQSRGVAYPMPPRWLDEHEAANRQLYNSLDVQTVARKYPHMLLCLRHGTPISVVAAAMEFRGTFGPVRCWQTRS